MTKADLRGLVLCGGRSTRMGRDKSWIEYHGQPQSLYIYALLKSVCKDVNLSINKNQSLPLELMPHSIIDIFDNIGPAGGILSANKLHPNKAWLVIACDMPNVSYIELKQLIAARSGSAVAFNGEFLEPLLSIWEPAAIKALESRVSLSDYSLKAALEQVGCKKIEPKNLNSLQNFNDQSQLDSFVSVHR